MDQSSDEITFKELIIKIKEWVSYLKYKWKVILLACILCGAVGILYAWLNKPVYTAVTNYALDDEKSSGSALGGALGLANSLGFDLGGSGAGGAFGASNLMELMHSRYLIEKTLLSDVVVESKKITLAEFYIEANELRKKWPAKKAELTQIHFPVDANRTFFTRLQDSVLGSIYADMDKKELSIFQKDKKVAIGTIEVKSTNELFAKLFCENLVKEVTEFYVATKSKKARINVAILQKQTDSIRAELNSAITGVASANDNTFNLNPVFSVHKTPATKRQVDVQANTAILTQLVTNLELAKVTLLKETPLIQVIDKPILPLKKEKSSRLISLIVGGFLGGFFTILFLTLKRAYKNIMA